MLIATSDMRHHKKKSSRPQVSTPKPRVCLSMIVKDEAHVIEDCLLSIVHLVDYYVINDTGSKDDTKERIKAFFDARGIRGEIVTHEFRTCQCHPSAEFKKYEHFHFGWNRTFALQQCLGKSEYIFIMDADDVIEGTLIFPNNLNVDQYYLQHRTDFNHYYRPQLIRNARELNWSYADGLHEFLKSDNPNVQTVKLLGDYTIHSRRLGSRNHDLTTKYLNDVAFLKVLIEERPNYARYRHYYAQSYYDAQMYADSIREYQAYLPMETFEEAKHLARLMIGKAYLRWINQVKTNSSANQLEVLELQAKMIAAFEDCFQQHGEYAEAMFELCKYFNGLKDYETAFAYGSRAVHLPMPFNKILPVNQGIYDYQFLDEMTWCASQTSRYTEALQHTIDMLHRNRFPPERKDVLLENMVILRRMAHGKRLDVSCLNGRVVGIYIGPSPTKIIYGSELAALHLARAFASASNCYNDSMEEKKSAWDNIIIFLDAYPPCQEAVDVVSSCKSVTFLPSSLLVEGIPAQLDTMIVSRYIKYFTDVDAARVARRTFMWLHDVDFHPYIAPNLHLPLRARPLVRNLLMQQTLVQSIICSSPWHKAELLSTYGLDEDRVHVVGLGLDAELCCGVLGAIHDETNAQPQRKRNRFIWVADENRDLDIFLTNIFPTITSVLRDAELHIYRELSEKLKNKAMAMHGVTLCGHASNRDILRAMAESDYFVYITEFRETFCLSALEAQAMGCICITSPVAALETTVGDRGFIIKDLDRMRQILKDLDENPDKKERIRSEAQEWALRQSWEAIVKEGWQPLFLGRGEGSSSSKRDMHTGLMRLRKLGLQPNLILDVGANVGDWHLLAKSIFPGCPRILSYEANPACQEALKERGIEFDIVLLGDDNSKTAKFICEQKNSMATGASIFREQTQFYNTDDAVVITELPMRRLDDVIPTELLLQQHVGTGALLKLDVQGAELLVLKGASETLKRCDFVLVEAALMQYNKGAPLFAEIVMFMRDQGYLVMDVIENHYVQGLCVQCDVLFLNTASPWTNKLSERGKPVLDFGQSGIFGGRLPRLDSLPDDLDESKAELKD